MVSEDRQRWNQRYREAVSDPSPRAVLVDAAELLPPPGRALDLACGRGAEAVWLAARGWLVDAVDIADVALDQVLRLADAAGVRSRLRVIQADLDEGLPESCVGPYDLLVMGHFRSVLLETAIEQLLRPAAVVVTSRLSMVGRVRSSASEVGSSGGYLAVPDELADLAQRLGLNVLYWQQGEGETALVARTAASPHR